MENNELDYKRNNYTHLSEAIDDLEKNIRRYQSVGNIGLIISGALFVVLGFFVYHLFEGTLSSVRTLGLEDTVISYTIDPKKGAKKIVIKGDEAPIEQKLERENSESFVILDGEARVTKTVSTDNTSMVVLSIVVYILRTSLLGSFVLLSLTYTVKFTTSSFDQAVRFTKRKHASQFLLEMFKHYNPEISNVPKIMDAFGEWNVNVESAYTDVKANEKAFKTFFEHLGKLDETSTNKAKDKQA